MQALWYLHKKSTPFPSKIKSLPLLFPSLSRHRHLQLSFFFESSLLFTNFHKYSLKHSSRYNFVCSLTTSSVSSTRVVYANLIQWYASIIDCVDASDTISHWWDSGNATDASWQKKKRIACQIVVVAQSTAYFATCTMKSPSPEWLESGGDLGPHCRPKSTNKQPVIIEGAKWERRTCPWHV